jgi:hypothetical protein
MLAPSRGHTPIIDADLVTFRFEPEWTLDWLWRALSFSSVLRRRLLLPNRAWYLGEAACGASQVSIVFARRISTQADLDLLASVLRPVRPAEKGLVITTSSNVARQVALPNGYDVLLLREIVKSGPDGLTLDDQRIGFWIRGMQPTTAKGARTRAGRPSTEGTIEKIFNMRRDQGLRVESGSAEAKAILAEWNEHEPGLERPGHSTVRRHMAGLIKAKAAS